MYAEKIGYLLTISINHQFKDGVLVFEHDNKIKNTARQQSALLGSSFSSLLSATSNMTNDVFTGHHALVEVTSTKTC